MLDIFNKEKTEDGFSVLRLLIGMFALWTGSAAREKVTVKAEGGWTDMVTKDRHLGEQQLALRWRSLFLMCAN